jgi:hypothetical protein
LRLFIGRSIWSVVLAVSLIAAFLFPLIGNGPGPVGAEGPNLIKNWSFEEGSWAPPGMTTSNLGNSWAPWWRSPGATETKPFPGYLFIPEYGVRRGDPFPPFKDSNGMQKMHTFSASHEAGFWQKVSGLSPGTPYLFTIWAWGFSANKDGNTSDNNPGALAKAIGIDPTGGQDGLSGNVVWSPDN